LLVIIATAEKEKALTALMFVKNAWGGAWFDDVKVVFFGPSEKLIAQDEEVAGEVRNISVIGESFACITISNKDGTTEKIREIGLTLVGVGPVISKLINDGYVPMVW
jgi:hypothetical protein